MQDDKMRIHEDEIKVVIGIGINAVLVNAFVI